MKIIKKLTAESGTLGEKTAKGGFWLSVTKIATRVFDFVRTIVLARLLLPADFGIFGVVLLVNSIVETFTETGFGQAIIKDTDESDTLLNTAWTVTIIKSLLVAIVLFGLSYLAVVFFNSPEAGPMIRVASLYIVINGFTNIKAVYLQKQMKFHKQFVFLMAGSVSQTVVSIALAIILRNAWALVIGMVAGATVKVISSYIIVRYKPMLAISKEKLAKLWNFGKWLTGSSILTFLLLDADDIVVGKLLGTESLGFYQLAYRISNLPATEISRVVADVSFPAYASIQEKVDKLRIAFSKVLQTVSFSTIPLGVIVFSLAASFTALFLGDNWLPIIPAIEILAIFGIIRSFESATGSIFLASGKVRTMTLLQLLQVAIMYSLIVPLTLTYGIIGASIAVLTGAIIDIILRFIFCARIIGIGAKQMYIPVLTGITTVLLPALAVFALRAILDLSPLAQFSLEATSFIVLYFSSSLLVSKLVKDSPFSVTKRLFTLLFR